MDVWEYFADREREYRSLSLWPDFAYEDMFLAEEGSDGTRGKVLGNLRLMPEEGSIDAFLAVYESVQSAGTYVNRVEYSYYLIVDMAEAWGYELDLSHDPPTHCHIGPDHTREESDEKSFREVAELAWGDVTDRVRTAS